MYSNLPPKGEWFVKHLNWTVILYWFLAALIFWVLIFVLSVVIVNEDAVFALWSILGIVYLSGLIYLLVWNVKHKGRSAFNLFYILIPFGIGWIVFLCINNRDQLAKEKAEDEERESYAEEYWKEHGGKPDIPSRWF